MGWGYYYYPKYVSVAERKEKALRAVSKLGKKGQKLNPVKLEGRTIATSVWGKAWCKNLEFYSDYANRLPRGRSYVRNGLVVDLKIIPGQVQGLVYGSSLYKVLIKIDQAAEEKWQAITKECSGKIDSLVELLQGKFSKSVMEIITRPESGLFPHPKEIKLSCSCPDYATMCKHVAAVLYAVGARLDIEPEALFTLRQVDHMNLITAASTTDSIVAGAENAKDVFATTDLSELFGIDIEQSKQEAISKAKPIKIKRKIIHKSIKKTISKNKQNEQKKQREQKKQKKRIVGKLKKKILVRTKRDDLKTKMKGG